MAFRVFPPLDVVYCRCVFGEQKTPAGKVPLDHVMWLREIRNRDLEADTGIDNRYISDYRKGKKPRAEHRELIAKALDLSQEDLGWATEAANA